MSSIVDHYKNLAICYINEIKTNNLPLPQQMKGETTKGLAWRDEETQKIWVSIYPRKELSQLPVQKGAFKNMVKNICYCEDGEMLEVAKLISIVSFSDERFCKKVQDLENEYNIRSSLNGVLGVPKQHIWITYEGNKASLGGQCQKIIALHEHKGCNLSQLITDQTIPVGSINNRDWLRFHYGIFKSGLIALCELHYRNILINDLTVNNVLVDSEAEVSFCDFGFSANLHALDMVEKSKVMQSGTHMTMSPERIMYSIHPNDYLLLQDMGLEGDVWSLGLIYFRMYYGANHIAYDRFRPLYDIVMNTKLQATELEWVVLGCQIDMAKSNIKEFILQIEEFYANNTLRSGIEGWIDRMLHPDRKQRYTAKEALDQLLVLGQELGFES